MKDKTNGTFGIIICDKDSLAHAGSIGRQLLTDELKNWRKHFVPKTKIEEKEWVKSGVDNSTLCFNGRIIIMLHGQYGEVQKGILLIKGKNGSYINITQKVIKHVNNLCENTNQKHIYIHACGQGKESVLEWYKGSKAFDTKNVFCPHATASILGTINVNEIKQKLNI